MTDARTQSVKFYYSPGSRSSTVLWMLEEVGAPYDIELINLKAGAQRSPEYLAINPMGKVPTISHNGAVVTESAAICCYLADAFPHAGLAPAIGDPLRGPYLKWLFYAPSCIEPAMIENAANIELTPRGMTGWGSYDRVMATLRGAVGKASPYLLGERFTTADVVIGATLRFGMSFKTIPELPEFVAYAKRLEERPALQRQIAIEADYARQITG
ncbi:glutathione S-transferase family protein [Hyphomicrobium sulfonivorans]|uniref:glutathione S-transferase family protein n=1 Tax=Hyphomicrobium sulfonivorans TaxID=121290 RepID=UPI00156F1C02|nr:glutathione S-transferase family protein [Hyphomicrobium sulfonivorans]MBI1651254.1 glutathione S-transferase family protein [Hyphomicrobium sulfonivorans]NSL73138.1 glutathione S-transferase [Hyphomicrobium sulfonivorans]